MPDTPDKPSLSAKEALEQIFKQPHVPQATYRLQFGPAFTFEDAQDLVDYLAELGISDLYASPLYKPRSNSTHGYDTVDYNQFNPRLGTEEDFDALADALRARSMSILLDIVPNHMGVNTENEWWMDVLKHGPSSVYADYFDIDWRPRNRALDDRVLLPVLGDHYGRILEAGEFELVYWHGDFYLHYYEHQFPITPESYAHILPHVHAQLLKLPHEDWVEMELSSVITALEHMPPFTSQDETALEIRRREQVIVRWRLLGLFDKSEAFRAALQEALDILNGTPGEPESFDELDRILSQQPYYLAYWRVASDEINYRRFFDINDMAAIRIEDPQVFAETHRLTLRLLAAGKIGGLRIDHPDGLWSPHMYFLRLQEAYVLARLEHITTLPLEDPALVTEQLATLARSSAQPARWPLYVLAEKILSETEPLPYSWAVYGTTGYDFLNVTNNLFVDSTNETAFDELYSAFIDNNMPFHDLTDYTKKLVMSQSLTSEIDARSLQLARVVEQNRRYRGFTRNSLAFAMSEIIAAMSIYRTYITGRDEVSERDRHYLELAVETAKQQNQFTPSSVFDFLRDTILKENWADFTPEQRRELNNFVMKFQQITGPVMAKSVEDTAFYVYNRLVSLNEVGGHPDQFGISPDDFHRHNAEKTFPYTMLSSSTHDTKRSEDVRARINVLSEIPNEWAAMLEGWHAHNTAAKTQVEGDLAPSRNDEYLLYQTLVSAYEPHADRATFRDRIIAYMHKAINEAKTHSNWINPNDAYARAIAGFVSHILDDDDFMEEFETFQQRVAFYGRLNALAQTTLKLTSPGVPDIYQGNELWDYSLVDPDNRRPVDFDRRRELLAAIQAREATDRAQLARDLVTEMPSGAIKLYLIYRVLNYRQEHRQLFEASSYHPLAINGAKAGNACAFLRRTGDRALLVVVPRLVVSLTAGGKVVPVGDGTWTDTRIVLPPEIAAREWHNILTGDQVTAESDGEQPTVRLAEVLGVFPVGILEAEL